MEVFNSLIGRIQQFHSHAGDTARSVFEQDEYIQAYVIDLNRAQLQELGMRSDGILIESYAPYAPFTVMIKEAKGQPTDRVTLFDEGDFHGGFFLTFDSDGMTVWSRDGKTEELAEKYGEEIFGLTKENMSELRDYSLGSIREAIQKQFKSVINGDTSN